MDNQDKLIIANCSGFFGDRFSAAREMVRGGEIDFLTGDYLAELTMAILLRKKRKDPARGFVSTFLRQMEEVMAECMQRGIKVVSNAGGLNPPGLADALSETARELGLSPKIAYVQGDDILDRIDDLQHQGEEFLHRDKWIGLQEAQAMPISANAYLGGFGISKALEQGADIVVTGRVADASLVTGPAAWYFGWEKNEWDKLAGAVAAGHVIECGAQATGGNYSFMDEVPSFRNLGFPICEIMQDGSSVISKHPHTGGVVSVGTVTAQLLYEIDSPQYLNPDVTARFDTLRLRQEGEDRVSISGARGEPPPETTKVCINNFGGFRNSMTVVLTGLDIEEKADIVQEELLAALGGEENFTELDIQLIRSDKEDPGSNEEAFAYLKITAVDQDGRNAGKLLTSRVVEMALANIPGFNLTAPPGDPSPLIIHWPALVSAKHISQQVVVQGEEFQLSTLPQDLQPVDIEAPAYRHLPDPNGETRCVPLGRAFATRSGDKGGNANLGVWSKHLAGYSFLKDYLTVEKLQKLLPDLSPFDIERYEFPNLNAVNFYIKGILGDGAAACKRLDPQAKTLGEYLRARVVDLPESIIVDERRT